MSISITRRRALLGTAASLTITGRAVAANAQTPLPTLMADFPPMYYDSPITEVVFQNNLTADDTLTAVISAGSAYFSGGAIEVFNWETVEVPAPGTVPVAPGAPTGSQKTVTEQVPKLVATYAAGQPATVTKGQHIEISIQALVPNGSPLSVGNFAGTLVVSGKNTTQVINLQGTYLGTLMGKVTVQPATVVPGQSVLIQVNNASGNPISDPTVSVTIQGVPITARYYQFPTIGNRNFVVQAKRGSLSETTLVTVPVAGTPLAFRPTLTSPTVTAMPMLQASWVPGMPYAATFTLGTTPGGQKALAAPIAKSNAALPTTTEQPIATPTRAAPTDDLGVAFNKLLTTLPADKITRIGPISTKTAFGTATSSVVLAPVGGLQGSAEQTSYKWDFGDGQTATTQIPSVTHDFFPAMRATDLRRAFNVSCTAVQDNVTVQQTLVLHSPYGLSRQIGVIVPPVAGDTYATFQQVAFSASLIVNNLEGSPITLSSMACVPVSDDTSVAPPAPQFTIMQVPLVVAATSASALGVYIPLAQLQLNGATVNGFTVYYSGTMPVAGGTSMPVRFSRTFRIPLTDSGWAGVAPSATTTPPRWDVTSALQAVASVVTSSASAVSKVGGQTIDPATKTVAISLSTSSQDLATLTQVRAAVQAGLTSIAIKTGALSANGAAQRLPIPVSAASRPSLAPRGFSYNPLNPPSVTAGNQCYPDDISDADAATASAQQLVCQLTGQTQTVTIPASFQNAQAGDVILSPAPVDSGDLIAAMFAALTPPQHHGHSGIMTANFFEITHCTASNKRITNNLNYATTPGGLVQIPVSLKAPVLQYGWPGSITQSINDATSSVSLQDPSDPSGNTTYSFNSFNTSPQGEGLEIIYPIVVKPLPENEATARPTLRTAAATARSKGAQYDSSTGARIQGGGCYYSFYAYTDPQLSANFTDAATASDFTDAATASEAGWAEGLSPAVCSSFVWLSMKANNIPLITTSQYETLSNFSPLAIQAGAQVGSETLDGLVYYPQAERLQAAQALYQMLMNQALSQEQGLGTLPSADAQIAGPIADQLLNEFASGNPNMVGSTAWQTPGDGNAVSPDNILFWNPPYFGYAEPLQYLPQHTEQYTTSQWVQVTTWGTITGTVTANGAPVANAQVWVYLPGGSTSTAADGTYTLSQIPLGSYGLTAQAVITSNGVSLDYNNTFISGSGTPVTLTAAEPNIVVNVQLQGTPGNYRELDIQYSTSCDHGDNNPAINTVS